MDALVYRHESELSSLLDLILAEEDLANTGMGKTVIVDCAKEQCKGFLVAASSHCGLEGLGPR